MKTRSESSASSSTPRWRLLRSVGPATERPVPVVSLNNRSVLTLGRGTDIFGAGAFDCDRISRRHAGLRVDGDGQLAISDLDSHNGVRVNGRPTKHTVVRDGAVIVLGGVILHALRTREELPQAEDEVFSGIGPTIAMLRRAAAMLGRRQAHVVLHGPTGTGKRHVAQEIHRRSNGKDFVRVDATDDRDTEDDDALAARAENGTLYVDGIEGCSPATERLLRRLLMGNAPPPSLRIIASTREPVARVVETETMRPELVARVARWSITLPPLRERREDIPALARALLKRLGGPPRAIHPRLFEALCLAPWPGNLHQLDATIGRIATAATDEHELTLQHYDATTPRAPVAATSTAIRIQSDGEWFQHPGGARVELAGRHALCRLLAALLNVRRHDPNQRLTARELAAAGWPDDDPDTRAVINRVYVAVSTLRNLGLRDALDRTPQGYRFDPGTAVEAVETSSSPSRASS